MARNHMWFGTQGYMKWVPCPAINVRIGTEGWGESGTYLGGGGYAKNSVSSHKVFDFNWNTASREEVYSVLDYAEHIYGTGLIYFLDPFAMDTNALPAAWAQPGIRDEGSPSLLTTNAQPTTTATAANSLNLPAHRATYAVANNGRTLFVPVPPGYTLHFGWVGSVTGSGAVQANGTAVAPTAIGASAITWATRTTDTTIRLWGSGNVNIDGMIAQVLPNGKAPTTTKWVSGRGHSGCRFQGRPSVTGLSAALDKVSASATLIETGDWE